MGNSQRCAQSHVFTRRRSTASKRASAFNSENPFFMVLMGKSYIIGNTNMTVPSGFLRGNSIKENGQIVMLQLGDKSWPVKVLSYPRWSRVALSGGWAAFAKDNTLQVGYIYVFELIESDKVILKVSIFRS
ncbi:B3 domain-containing protein REM19 [Morella rubra]|uniref:B3 domain-containing protein REM19 n=1 Tax=Morella rubra TaxID=262757 RepID=A0A6A1UYT4_9ROSI|nr:B3 domain-containing protein REM19 [Morella rubra]